MKIKLYLLGILSMLIALSACSEDSVPIIDLGPGEDPQPEEPAPDDEPELDADLFGAWVLDPTAGSLAVGPSPDDLSWWAISASDVETRACLYDDLYIFHEDGSFENSLGGETWLEPWQGADPEGCGAPVAPHDGESTGTWSTSDNSVTISGSGVFLGLPKVHNTGENGSPANNTITYTYALSDDGNILEITIKGWNADVPEATWLFRFTREGENGGEEESVLSGSWLLDPTAGSLAVGPSPDDLSWWAISASDVETRACLYDDLYIFHEDGSFENSLGGETWLEAWQGADPEGCGAPVAPHDGENIGTWTESGNSVTITGSGNYLGLAKVHNNGEDGSPANDTITYNFSVSDDGNTLEITIDGWNSDVPDATWFYRFTKQ